MNINWPELIAGVVLGLLPLAVRQFYLYFRFLRSPGKRRYLGHWHSYWRSTTGVGRIGHEELEVRYSFIRNTLLVKNTSRNIAGSGATEFVGQISEREGVVRYWNLHDHVTHVHETWIMVDPYYDPIDIAEGVQVTVDIRGLPVATGQLISRTEVEPEELERRIPLQVINTDPLKYVLGLFSQQGAVSLTEASVAQPSPETGAATELPLDQESRHLEEPGRTAVEGAPAGQHSGHARVHDQPHPGHE